MRNNNVEEIGIKVHCEAKYHSKNQINDKRYLNIHE